MASGYVGNILLSPGYQKNGAAFDDELLASTGGGFTQRGVTLAGGQGILPLGCILGQVTATKKWKVYVQGNSDGTQVPRGVLRNQVDTNANSNSDVQGNIVIAGILVNDRVSGADANALTVLKARQDTIFNTFTF